MPKLYEILQGNKIIAEVSDGSPYFTFDHLDGMYSYCLTPKGNVIHIKNTAELELLPNGEYKLKE